MKLSVLLLFLLVLSTGISAQSITGDAAPCPGTVQRYTLSLPCSGASVAWSVHPGKASINQMTLNADIIFENELLPSGVNKVIADISCGGKTSRVEFTVNVKALPAVPPSPPIYLPCNFSGVKWFTVPKGPAGTVYQWSNNSGWPVYQGAGTSEIGFNIDKLYSWSVVKVKISNECAGPEEHSFNIITTNIGLAAPSLNRDIIPLYICKRSTQDLYLNQDIPNATEYIWSADQASIRINGQVPPVTLPAATGKRVTISNVDDAPKTAVISCRAGSGTCAPSAPGTIALQVNTVPVAYYIEGMPPGGNISSGDHIGFYVDQHPAFSSYRWSAFNGTITSGQGTNQVWVRMKSVPPKSSVSFSIDLTYVSACGESNTYTEGGRINGAGGTGPETFTISPNPASDILRVNDSDYKSGTSYEVKIYDMNHQEVRRGVSQGQQQLSMNISGLKNGHYIVQINRNGKITASHILIQR